MIVGLLKNQLLPNNSRTHLANDCKHPFETGVPEYCKGMCRVLMLDMSCWLSLFLACFLSSLGLVLKTTKPRVSQRKRAVYVCCGLREGAKLGISPSTNNIPMFLSLQPEANDAWPFFPVAFGAGRCWFKLSLRISSHEAPPLPCRTGRLSQTAKDSARCGGIGWAL